MRIARPRGWGNQVKAERNELIYAERQAGATLQQLAHKYGVARSRVCDIVSKTERMRETARWREAMKVRNEQIVTMYTECGKIRAVAEFFDLSHERVRSILGKK